MENTTSLRDWSNGRSVWRTWRRSAWPRCPWCTHRWSTSLSTSSSSSPSCRTSSSFGGGRGTTSLTSSYPSSQCSSFSSYSVKILVTTLVYSSSNTKGWLKTAETMYDPFGEDEEDYNICDLLERHLRSTWESLSGVTLSCRRAGNVYVSHSEDTPEILDAESESAAFINNNDRYQTLMSNIQDIKGSIQSYDIVLCIHFI